MRIPLSAYASLIILAFGIVPQQAFTEEPQKPAFMLPDFASSHYDCRYWVSSAQVMTSPSSIAGAYNAFFQDAGGAEIKGDIRQSVAKSPFSTITFNGKIVILPCQAGSGSKPITVEGNRLRFELSNEGRLVYQSGSGSVTVENKTTRLPEP